MSNKNLRSDLNIEGPYDERALLARVAEGDESAFCQLFRHWHQLLAGYIFRITESRESTEEIVQDVFMKIWTIRETMTEINNFKHFLLVVSRNKAFDVMKKQLREKALRRGWEKENVPEPLVIDNEEELIMHSLIEQAIESLPPRRKEVFQLSRNERLKYKEIAARLDISQESVKTHIRLAIHSIGAFIRSHPAEFALVATTLLKIF